MSEITSPVLTDGTGQDIVTKLDEIKQAISGTVENNPIALNITSYPTRRDFVPGEALDLSGIVVKALFANGSQYDVTQNCIFTPANGSILTENDDRVSVSWSYTPSAQTFTVEFSINIGICSWSSGTPEQLAAALNAHYRGDIDLTEVWSVGQKRKVSLSAMEATGVGESHAAQDVFLVLSQIGGKTLADGVTTCAFQFDLENALNEAGYINYNDGEHSTNEGGWKSCERRTWCNSVFKNAFPENIRGIFKEFINQSGVGGGSSFVSGVEDTIDTFALRAEVEILGTHQYAADGEGSQVTLYETSTNRIKQVNGEDATWWGRSPVTQSNAWLKVTTLGACGSDSTYRPFGIAPFGCI